MSWSPPGHGPGPEPACGCGYGCECKRERLHKVAQNVLRLPASEIVYENLWLQYLCRTASFPPSRHITCICSMWPLDCIYLSRHSDVARRMFATCKAFTTCAQVPPQRFATSRGLCEEKIWLWLLPFNATTTCALMYYQHTYTNAYTHSRMLTHTYEFAFLLILYSQLISHDFLLVYSKKNFLSTNTYTHRGIHFSAACYSQF